MKTDKLADLKSDEEYWAPAKELLDEAVWAYEQLVELSDKLAILTGEKEDEVLKKILPCRSDARRDPRHICVWGETIKPDFVEQAKETDRVMQIRAKRDALVKTLGLTKDQLAILTET